MNNLKNKSSLILTPNAYKEGTLFNYKPLGTDFTFQRNTTATRINKDGLIEVVGNNIPRLDYLNGDCPEILIEPQATNLCTRSDPNSLPFSQNISFQENDWSIGLSNKMVFDNQNGTVLSTTGGFGQNSLGIIDTTKINRVSFYIKRQDGLKPIIATVFDTLTTAISLSNNNQIDVYFQDVVSSSKFYYNYTEKEVGNGVWFMTFDFSATSGSSSRTMGFIKNPTNSTNVVEVSGIQVIELDNLYGNPPSLEDRELTSYIPTNGTIATRNADIAFINNYSNIFGNKNSRVIELNGQNNIYIDREDFQLPNGRIKLSYEVEDLIKGQELEDLNVNEIKYGERDNIKDEYTSTINLNPSLSLIPGKKDIGEITTLIPRESDDFDFQRNTTATYVDKDGLIKTALENEPRLNYKDGEFDGLLIEPQSTNIIEFSNDFTQWNNVSDSVTITPNFEISLDGTQNATKLLNSTTSPRLRIGINREPNTTYTASFFAKNLVGNTISWRTAAIQLLGGVEFDLINGTFNFNNVREWNYENVEMQNYGNGWWRCIITYTTTENSLNNDEGFIAGSGSFENENLIFGVQLEEGTSATSYIPTAGTIATRNADVALLDDVEDLIGQTEGSVYFEFTKQDRGTIFALFSGSNPITSSNRISFFIVSKNRMGYTIRKNNIVYSTASISPPNNKPYNKSLIIYTQNSFKVFIDGVLFFQNTYENLDFSEKLNRIQFGSISERANGFINNIAIFKTALTDQQAINLTTI